jgi:V-type H+-transporting ATPase subunit H
LVERKFNDEDVHDDIVVIDDTLARFMTTLTSFSKYQTEIMTGRLQWSPVHSEKFWRENADRFEDDGFLLIRRLIELLDSEDELTVEVACYDLGEFARFHPDGRKVVDKLGAKRKLMAKMAHKQSKSKKRELVSRSPLALLTRLRARAVAKMALLSVQKLMVQNWESLTVAK